MADIFGFILVKFFRLSGKPVNHAHPYCQAVWSCDMRKISVNDKILTEILRKEKRWSSKKLLSEFSSKGWSRSGLDSLLRRMDARGSADQKVAWAYFFGPPGRSRANGTWTSGRSMRWNLGRCVERNSGCDCWRHVTSAADTDVDVHCWRPWLMALVLYLPERGRPHWRAMRTCSMLHGNNQQCTCRR